MMVISNMGLNSYLYIVKAKLKISRNKSIKPQNTEFLVKLIQNDY